MTTTLTATSTAGVAPSPAIRPVTWIGRLRQAIGDIRTVTVRYVLRARSQPDLIIGSLLMPVIFIVLFGYLFGSAIHVPGGHYRTYLISGLFAQMTIFGSSALAVAVATDMSEGVIDRFRTMPIARPAVLAGPDPVQHHRRPAGAGRDDRLRAAGRLAGAGRPRPRGGRVRPAAPVRLRDELDRRADRADRQEPAVRGHPVDAARVPARVRVERVRADRRDARVAEGDRRVEPGQRGGRRGPAAVRHGPGGRRHRLLAADPPGRGDARDERADAGGADPGVRPTLRTPGR